jgi:uncharacterized membrane protein (UPF0127 family)
MPGRRAHRLVVAAGLMLLVLAGTASGPSAGAGTGPSDPAGVGTGPSDPAKPVPSRLKGFEQVGFRVDPAGKSRRLPERCGLLAVTAAQQALGLMHRHNLDGYAGMIFQWTRPIEDGFWMKNTLIPLSVAWFDAGGHFISRKDMAPCPPTSTSCPVFSAGRAYTVAIEVPRGALAGLGIGPGSLISIGGRCPSGGGSSEARTGNVAA